MLSKLGAVLSSFISELSIWIYLSENYIGGDLLVKILDIKEWKDLVWLIIPSSEFSCF